MPRKIDPDAKLPELEGVTLPVNVQNTYRAIIRFGLENGRGPTVIELAREIKATKQTAHAHLGQIRASGLVDGAVPRVWGIELTHYQFQLVRR